MSATVSAMYRFCWHDLMSTDPEASRKFYSALFPEWTVTNEQFGSPGTGEFTFWKITVDGLDVGSIVPFEKEAGYPSHWMASVAVEDCDESIARAEAVGGKRCYPSFDAAGVGRFAVISDAQGAFLKVLQPFKEVRLPENPADGHFSWNELITPDAKAAKPLYKAAFGWDSYDADMGPEGVYVLFTLNGKEVGGAMTMPPDAESPPCWLPYITADDLDARFEKAKGLGAKVYVEPRDIPGIGRFCVVAEPTGATFAMAKWFPKPS